MNNTFCLRFGFLQDNVQASADSDILSPHYSKTAEPSFPHFYVHHTGTALLQLVAQVPPTYDSDTRSLTSRHSSRKGRHMSNPRSTSSPSHSSPARFSIRSTSSKSSQTDGPNTEEAVRQCGFYWHRNCLLPKQKNIPPGLLAQYDSLYEKFVDCCRNRDEQLTELYDQVSHF